MTDEKEPLLSLVLTDNGDDTIHQRLQVIVHSLSDVHELFARLHEVTLELVGQITPKLVEMGLSEEQIFELFTAGRLEKTP